jgi:magnesium-transporting ATPase (P-type)
MPFDPAHFVERFFQPFNPESRFYWPAVYSLLLALIANIVWYNWRRRGVAPPESAAKPWAFWINVVFVIVIAVLLYAKAPFYLFALLLAVNVALLVYMYWFWLPPQEAAYGREQRRRQYFPQPKKKRRRQG